MISRKVDGSGRTAAAPPRTVPGFCAQANQKGTVTAGPDRPKNRTQRAGGGGGGGDTRTSFSANYGLPGFPLAVDYAAGAAAGRWFRWLVPIESVNYATCVPMLVDGLRERPARPYGACAAQALWDLLARDHTGGDRVLAAVPHAVFPLRRALDAGPRDWSAVVRALVTLQRLAGAADDGRVARALVPYFRQLLPPLGRYGGGGGGGGRASRVTASDGLRAGGVTYNVSDLCADTLARLERAGGPSAYASIKYAIPTYESTVAAAVAHCGDDDDHGDGDGRPYRGSNTSRIVAPCPSLCSGLDLSDAGADLGIFC